MRRKERTKLEGGRKEEEKDNVPRSSVCTTQE